MTKLTLNTAIPTPARGKVRAFIKAQPQWEIWCAKCRIVSREAKNKDLIDFAMTHGLDAQVLTLIGGKPLAEPGSAEWNAVVQTRLGNYDAPLNVPEVKSCAPFDSFDEMHAMQALKAEEENVAMLKATQEAAEGSQEHFVIINGDAVSTPVPVEAPVQTKAEDILANVDQFLSPFVRAEIEKAIQPLIAAANKPPVTVEVEKVVTVQAMPTAPEGALPYAIPGAKVELGKVFGFKGNHSKHPVTLWESHGAAPAMDPMYVVDPYQMAMMATALEWGTNVWLVGPGGSGKTSMPMQFCAFTGRPFVRINFTRNSHVDDMVGGQGVKQGDSGWEDGVLLQAMLRPGTVILLDEISLAPAGVQGIFQGCADEQRTYTRPDGRKVVAAPGVVFVVADNTAGYGDETGLYHGTNPCNTSLVNRFGRMLKIDYMSIEQEAKALVNHCPGLPLPAAAHMAGFVARARKLPAMENVVLSLRNMTAFVRCVQDGFTPKQAAEVTMLTMLPSTERAALETLFTLTWESEFVALVSGSQADVSPKGNPGNPNADHGVFDDEVTASLVR